MQVYFLTVLEGDNSKIKMLANVAFGDYSLPGLQETSFSLWATWQIKIHTHTHLGQGQEGVRESDKERERERMNDSL